MNLSCNTEIPEGDIHDPNLTHAIAIIGMAVRLPEAEDYHEFWDNLQAGKESIRELPASRTRLAPFYDPEKQYARHGYIEGIDLFDAVFFKTLPAAARCIDPAQRLLMEVVNDAMEDAGYDREQLTERPVGVFFCDHQPEYYKYIAEQGLDTLAGNLPANLAGRIAYVNGFTGPALTIDTACSSGLVALHLAGESLRNGDCSMAFVGGATICIDLPEADTSGLGIMSPSGCCRSFSAEADGTVGGEGVIALLLKPLQAALADGDSIHAVIRGSAVNQDGSRSNGMTAPSPAAQKEVIQAAWRDAGINPLTIGYIEAHGSATKLGDPIEITGITDAFQAYTEDAGFCPLGTVKPNIGHLGNTAGLAGIVKTVLCLKRKMLPPTVHFRVPNPLIDFAHAPVYVQRSLEPWKEKDGIPRRAGVSSFGLSGTNAHVILEEAPQIKGQLAERYHLITLSASRAANMQARMEALSRFLQKHTAVPLADLAYTLQCRNLPAAPFRWAAAVCGAEELAVRLQSRTSGEAVTRASLSPVFLLPDYTAGAEGLLTELYQADLPVHEAVRECEEVFHRIQGGTSESGPQAVYFTFLYAMARFWSDLGLKPQSVAGFGVGEAVSAVLTKRLSLEEAAVKVLTPDERPDLKLEKLSQFIRQQLAKGRNLFLHIGLPGILAEVVQKEIVGRKDVYFFSTSDPSATKAKDCRDSATSDLSAKRTADCKNIPIDDSLVKVTAGSSDAYPFPSYEQSVDKAAGKALMETLAHLFLLGAELNWSMVFSGRRVSLPKTSYEKVSYWFDPQKARDLCAGSIRLPNPSSHEPVTEFPGLQPATGVTGMHRPKIREMTGSGLEEIAEVLTAIWRDRLGLEEIGQDEDFIELGGDSIRGMLLMRDIQTYFHVTLDIAYLLEYGTIHALAQKIWEEMLRVEVERETAAEKQDQPLRDETGVPELTEEPAHTASIPPAGPVEREESVAFYELSPSQQNLWLVHQFDPGEIAYNEPMPLILRGILHVEALTLALRTMVERHSAFRTFFTLRNGVPLQGVYDRLPVEIEYEDRTATGLSADTEALVHAETVRPFDLTEPPLFRAKLIRLRETEHLFIFIVHHIIFDGWSILVFMREICILYEAYTRGLPNPLPHLAVRYHDFAQWQNRLLAEGDMADSERYWMNKLTGDLPVLDLPADYPRPPQKSYAGSSVHFRLPRDISREIKEFGRRTGTTLFAVMLAFFEVLLYKYTGQEEFIIGTPSANRPHEDLWGLIGFFVNTFAVRQGVSGEESFAELLQRVRTDLLAAYPHKDYPFTTLVSRLNRKRDPGRSALFDVMYVFHNVGSIERPEEKIAGQYGGITFEEVKRRELVSDYDLKWEWEETDTHFNGKVEYSTSLFREETIRRMITHMTLLVTDIFRHPEKPLTQVSMLSEEERCQILNEWNRTEVPFPDGRTVPDLWAEQAGKTPERIAVVCGGRSMTCRMFDGLAGRLAAHLVAKGVRPNTIVPIMVERGWEMMIGIFGILKAGGAYLPIDPAFPEDRIQYIADDAKARLILVHRPTLAKASRLGAERIELESFSAAGANRSDAAEPGTAGTDAAVIGAVAADVAGTAAAKTGAIAADFEEFDYRAVRPTDLAYVIYTSGSTGNPKGVMMEHRGLINRLHWMQKTYPLSAEDTVLQKTPYTFDVSVWEILWWALTGARVSLLPPGGEKDPAVIVNNVQTHRVTTMHFVPSMLNVFLDYVKSVPGAIAAMAGVRQVFASGEGLRKKTVEEFHASLGIANGTRLHNLYGPTEAAIDVSYFDCGQEIPGEIVPIGRPIDNIQLYILDASLRLQPIGVPGEICIAGVGLARGYLNRPELTEAKFPPHFAIPAERMYRTGDRGRLRGDGNIEFLGRMDHQVKVRGYRIEPGEIEAALLQHPAIREAVVVAREHADGLNELVAYIVPREPVSAHAVRELLLASLPEYMIPAYYIELDAIPLLSSGKVDRRTLLQKEAVPTVSANHSQERRVLPPRNDLEAKMAVIWEKILRVENVSMDDNFFELGGDSIKAIQVAVEIGKIGIPVQMNDIIRHQTIDQVCAHLAVAAPAAEEPAVGKRSISGDGLAEGEAALTPIQHWFFEQDFAIPSHWNQSLLLEVEPGTELWIWEKAFHKLIEHHDVFRLAYHSKLNTFFHHNRRLREPFKIPLFAFASLTPEEQDQQLARYGEELKAGFDLESGWLIKAALFDLGARGRRLLVTIHHLVVDGVSWRILLSDLTLLCTQLRNGEEVSLPPKSMPYRDWADALAAYAAGDNLQREIPYWEEVLESFQPLPVEYHEGIPAVATVHTLTGELSANETEALLTQAHTAFHTNINDLLLTALAAVLTDWAGRDTVWIDLESHGRQELFPECNVGRTIGWFTAMYPLRIDYHGRSGMDERLKAVKESLRTVPHGGIGYGILRYLNRYWGEEKRGAEVVFNYLGQMDQTLSPPFFRIAAEGSGPDLARENHHICQMEVVCYIAAGHFSVNWSYSRKRYGDTAMQKLLLEFLETLRQLIRYCTDGEHVGYTPSDFPLAGLNQEVLDRLSADIVSVLEEIT